MTRFGAGLNDPLTLFPLGFPYQRPAGAAPLGAAASTVSTKGASLPRRHTISAAGALAAALLLAVQVPAGAQTAPDQSARNSTDVPQGSTSPRAQAADGTDQDQSATNGDASGGWGTTVVPESLGGTRRRGRGPTGGAAVGRTWRPTERRGAAAGRNRCAGRGSSARARTGAAADRVLRARPNPHRVVARASRPRSLSADRHPAGQLPAVSRIGSRRRHHQQRAGHQVRRPARRGTRTQAQDSPRFGLGAAFLELRG